MDIRLRPVSDLLDYTFVIPAFQRGYRWDFEQVEALLDDLKEYARQNEGSQASPDNYYCLQPFVVVPRGKGADGREKFDVIDAQQRLTTLYLILAYLDDKPDSPLKIYNLEFPKREYQQLYLSGRKFKADASEDDDRIDIFYMRKAYEVIEEYFRHEDEHKTGFREVIMEMLHGGQPKNLEVKVVWYEIASDDSFATYLRLNAGKIPLNSAELVKAIVLQSDTYGEMKEKAQALADKRAHEWNNMEHRLREDSYCGFLGIESGEGKAPMDVVLDFVADKLNNKNTKKFTRKPPTSKIKDTFNFNVINRYINEALMNKEQSDRVSLRMEAVKEVWNEIGDVFSHLCNWHDDRNLFHYIGLFSLLTGMKGSELISKIWNLEQGARDKKQFMQILRAEIGRRIKVNTARDEENRILPPEQQGLNSPNLSYTGSEKFRIISILTAHNVWTIMQEKDSLRRFPFARFRIQKPTSLEHIHPQNITVCEGYDDYKAWLDAVEFDRIEERVESEEERMALKRAKERIDEIFAALPQDSKERKEAFAKRLEEVRQCADIIDRQSMKLANITPQELHHIKNMALLDKETNSALQNHFMNTKRHILIERMNDKDDPVYVPQATLNVFSKHYNAGTARETLFWGEDERTQYLQDVQRAYNHFVD